MAVSELRLIKHCAEYLPQSEVERIPRLTRGIYVLYKYRPTTKNCDVVYVGMAAGSKTASIRGRLKIHRRKKGKLWTHFSAFEVWDNIREEEIQELEGIFRHIYRKDSKANRLNKQRGYNKLRHLRTKTEEEGWLSDKITP